MCFTPDYLVTVGQASLGRKGCRHGEKALGTKQEAVTPSGRVVSQPRKAQCVVRS